MKKLVILFLITLPLLVSSCSSKQPEVEIRYVERVVKIPCKKPPVPGKPQFKPYVVYQIEFEDKLYYCIDFENSKILIDNWLRYKNWCESLYLIYNENYFSGKIDQKTDQKN